MMMEYKILDNGTAVVLTRQPELVYDELYIDFSGAPSGATAIFEVGGDSLYRLLHGEAYGTEIYLGSGDCPDNWREITKDEFEEILEKQIEQLMPI